MKNKDTEFHKRVRDFEYGLIVSALEAHKYNREQAARSFGMSRTTFVMRIDMMRKKGYNVLDKEQFKKRSTLIIIPGVPVERMQ